MAVTELGVASARLGMDIRSWMNGLNTAQKRLVTFGAALQVTGFRISTIWGATVGALGGLSIKAAADFESSFAGVRKTVDATESEFKDLAQGMKDLSTEIPVNVNELNRIGEAAGQLGIAKEDIVDFTGVIAKLGVTTNIVGDEGSAQLARFANITDRAGTDFERLGDVIVDLGNNFATTEAEILDFALGLAGAGAQVGLGQDQILAIGTALSSVGARAQAGTTAIQTTFTEMQKAVATGGERLQEFARVTEMSVEQFKETFREDASAALLEFVEGLQDLGEGQAFISLEALGLGAKRTAREILKLSQGSDQLKEALGLAAEQMQNGGALSLEAAERFRTFHSQITLILNRVRLLAIDFGSALIPILKDVMLPVIEDLISSAKEWVAWFKELSPATQELFVRMALLSGAIGPITFAFGNVISTFAAVTSLIGKGVLPALSKLVPGFLKTGKGASAAAIATSKVSTSMKGFGVVTGKTAGTLSTFAGTGGLGALTVAGSAAAGVVSAKLTRSMDEFGGALGGADDHIETTVENVSLMRGWLVLASDAWSGLGGAVVATGSILADVASKIPVISEGFKFVKMQIDAAIFGFKGAAVALDVLGDKIAENTKFLFEEDNAARDATIATSQLFQASQIAGRAITDQAEAVQIINDRLKEMGVQQRLAASTTEETSEAWKSFVEEVGETGDMLRKAAEAEDDATERLEQRISDLADSLGVSGMNEEAKLMSKALEELNERSEKLSQEGLTQVLRMIDMLNSESQELPGRLGEISDAFRQFGSEKIAGLSLMPMDHDQLMKDMDNLGDEIFKAFDKGKKKVSDFDTTLFNLDGTIKQIAGSPGSFRVTTEKEFDLAEKASKEFRDTLEGLDSLFNLLGISADSFIGKLVGGLTSAGAAIKQLGTLGGGGIGGLFEGLKKSFSRGVGKGGILGLLGGISEVAGPIAAIAKPIADLVVPLLGKVFGGRDAQTVMEEAGRDLGTSMSEGLAQKIHESGSNIQTFLPEIFAEGGLSVDRLAEEVGDIFSVFERGEISRPEAFTALQESVSVLLQNMEELGPEGEMQVQRIISAAQRLGFEFEGLNELIQSTFAPATIEELKKDFGLTREEIKAIEEATGTKIQTNLQRMAAEAGLTVEQFKQLRDAASEHGIDMEQIDDLAAAMGITVAELAEAWGVGVTGPADATKKSVEDTNQDLSMGITLVQQYGAEWEKVARTIGGIQLPSAPAGTPDIIPAQGGFHHPRLPHDQLFLAHRGESVDIDRPDSDESGAMNVTVNVSGGTIIGTSSEFRKSVQDAVSKAVHKKRNKGGLNTDIRRAIE